MIPGCLAEELLGVAYVIVKTLKSIEGKILEECLLHEFCNSKKGAPVRNNNLSFIIHATYELYCQFMQNNKYTSTSF